MLTTLAQVLKSKAILIFPLGLIYTYLDQKITQGMFEQMMSTEGLGASIWFFAVAAILLGLIYPVLLIYLVALSVGGHKTNSFTWAIKEQMRATGSSLLWGLCFILPGFVRYFQLLLVPLVALAHPDYAGGQVDALKISRELVKKNWGTLLLLVLLFSVFVPVLLSSFDEMKMFSRSPVTAIAFSLIETLLSLVFLSLLWNLFSQSIQPQEKSL